MASVVEKSEEFQKARELLRETNLPELMLALTLMIRRFGDLMNTMGSIEKDHGNVFEAFKLVGKSPELLQEMVERTPPKVLGSFFKIIVQLSMIGSQMKKMETLSPEDKIKVSESMYKLAEEIENLMKGVKK